MPSAALDLNAIRTFVAVAEAGGIRQAAQRLGSTKSSVSRQLAELEEQLGARLVLRTTRAFALTDAGRALLERSRGAVQTLLDAGGHIAELGATSRGLVRISAPPSFVVGYLGAVVEEVLVRHPEIRVAVDASERHVDLLADGFDLAIRAGVLPDSALTCRRLGAARWRCFASPRYLAQRGTPQAPEELDEHDCIVHGSGDPAIATSWEFQRDGQRLTVPVTGRVAMSSLASVRDAARRGLGIARLLSFLAVKDDAGDGDRLISVLDDFAGPAVPLSAIWLPGEPRPRRVEAFLEILVARLGGAPWSALDPAPDARDT
jgi:DNA-binding transcriptional LysR family regulator